MTAPSKAASAQYPNVCPVCFAKPKQPCRTLKTGRVTDTHLVRIQTVNDIPPTRVGDWGTD